MSAGECLAGSEDCHGLTSRARERGRVRPTRPRFYRSPTVGTRTGDARGQAIPGHGLVDRISSPRRRPQHDMCGRGRGPLTHGEPGALCLPLHPSSSTAAFFWSRGRRVTPFFPAARPRGGSDIGMWECPNGRRTLISCLSRLPPALPWAISHMIHATRVAVVATPMASLHSRRS